jgi:pimeloyl-ACP methyl ester carboxylesterase
MKDNLSSAALCPIVALIAILPAAVAVNIATSAQTRHPQHDTLSSNSASYRSEEVRFPNERGPVEIAGTMSVPTGRAPFAAVLLIAASGPEGRDEEVAGHRVFVVLADSLLRKGIAVLRYDKRGVGESSGDLSTASFDDLVSDAAAAFRYLHARPNVDPKRVGIIGHSEGGSIAPAVAAVDQDVAFVVAMAGSGLNGEVRITEQQAYLAQEGGASLEQQAAVRVLVQRIFRTVAETSDDAAAGTRIAALIDAAVKANTLNAERASATRQLLTPTFVRQELKDDPVQYLKQVHVPVLALVGSLDRIVPAGPYVDAMRPVLKTIPGSEVRVLPGLNHVMQTARTGSPQEFGTIDETISPLALATIDGWVVRQVHGESRK